MEKTLELLNKACNMLHVDIMDGRLCDSLQLSPAFIRSIRSGTPLPIEAHLMVEHPENMLDQVAAAGADVISLHAETIALQAFRLFDRVHGLGCKAGAVLAPATPLDAVRCYLSRLDLLTVMTVDIGYAGQAFIPEMLDKIRQAAQIREQCGCHFQIQADGAVNRETYRPLYDAGARYFVLGSSGLFGLDKNLDTACKRMRREFAQALKNKEEEEYAG